MLSSVPDRVSSGQYGFIQEVMLRNTQDVALESFFRKVFP
jgi:hypothetical protein